ncbi:lipopolysaccharide biosynthesis protein [Halomonas aestuarii]|uniref:Lipopolysaccharide biosynthesis protein n=1 Tax=Halomonas aestuarii TaxID=1897729 RepID=A0A1J0VJ91_9GAMM|nr:Wzz/FepE/Etk N-terminal domain-containing protein [Halomonas aestuarii]APE32091.1 lipopolysaccharide biosynthesis protein [Halomonas aestuarii]
MNNSPDGQTSRVANDDEISLVDLAKILIKRWKLMTVTFLIIVLGALAYALMMERTYEFVSLYQVAEQATTDNKEIGALEPPATVVAKTSNLYLGSVTRQILADEGMASLPFETSVSNPEDTLLVRLASQAAEANAAMVKSLHAQVLERIETDQQALLERRREAMQRQLVSAERSLELANESTSPSAAELVASYSQRVADIQDRLAQLQEGQVVQTATQSLSPMGTSRSLVMALAIVLGGMSAVIMAFLSQFAVAVRESLQEE